METLQRTANRGSVSTGFDVANSLKLESDNSERLQKTPSGAGNRRTFTISFWTKRTEINGVKQYLFEAGNSDSNTDRFTLRFGTGDTFDIQSQSTWLVTNRVFRDTSAWYHFVIKVDTTDGTAANRIKLYVNGVEETSFSTDNRASLNQNNDFPVNNTEDHIIGNSQIEGSKYYNGYIAEWVQLDGTASLPTSFGEFDDDTGIWKPKDVSGLTFGTNGFYLDFEDSSNMGNDASGGTDFSLTNITAADQATDTCTNNFCTWSPLWAEPRANGTISEGATQVAWGGNAWKIARSSIAVSKGRWYWEIKGANVTGDTWNNNLFGFASTESDGQTGPSVLLGYSTGNYYYRVAGSQTGQDNFGNAGGAWSSSDTFAIALDLESSTKKFILYRNGSAVNGTGTDLVSAFQTEQFFTAYATAYNGDTQFLNWGGYTVNTISSAASDANGYGTFEYAPPSGYYAICTKNLAEFG